MCVSSGHLFGGGQLESEELLRLIYACVWGRKRERDREKDRQLLRMYALDSVVRQKCIVGSMSTPCPKLFILSAGLSTISVETADQELYLHPCGFTSSSPPQPSLPFLALARSLALPWLVLLQHLSPSLLLSVLLTPPLFSSVSLLLPLFSISVLLISPELPLTRFLFFFSFPLSHCVLTFSPLLPLCCWLRL